jgi:hypothetical protein
MQNIAATSGLNRFKTAQVHIIGIVKSVLDYRQFEQTEWHG